MLRTTLVLAGVLAGLSVDPSLLWAGPREEALALIDKAIKAHGGAAGMTKLQNCTRTGEGVMFVSGQEQPFTDSLTLSLPDRLKHTVDIDRRAKVVNVLNGDQGWTLTGGTVNAMPMELRQEFLEELYIWSLASLVPLTKGGYNLAPVDEIKVNDRPALGVRVVTKGRPEARLYFDRDNQLLVKVVRQARLAGVPVEKEYVFRAYRDFDGVRLPTRSVETLGGQKFSELKSATYTLKKPADSQFNRP